MTMRLDTVSGGAKFLQTLARRPDDLVDGRAIAVVVAHPDDETIGCGAMLKRLKGVSVIETTNGAPTRSEFWRPKGFDSAVAYTLARWQGLELALAMADVPADRIASFGSTDQETAFDLPALTQWLKNWLHERSIELVLTHAYEGGHPDHDGTAFAVHAAARLLQREYGRTPTVIEMPFYRLGRSGLVIQEFDASQGDDIFEIKLRDEEVLLKRRMYDAHASQRTTLKRFGTEIERFRIATRYEFSELPNGGDVLYDSRDWTVKGEQWLRLSKAALRDLALRHDAPTSRWDDRLLPGPLGGTRGSASFAHAPRSNIRSRATAPYRAVPH